MKECIHCGKSLSGTKDAARKKYCNKECYRLHRLSQPLTNKSTAHYRARTVVQAKVCQRCGSTQNLHIHHIDRNPLNDSINNLEVLCSTCHHKEHVNEKPLSTCVVCGKNFLAASHRNRNKICSALCAKEWGRINALKRWGVKGLVASAPTEMPSSRRSRKSS